MRKFVVKLVVILIFSITFRYVSGVNFEEGYFTSPVITSEYILFIYTNQAKSVKLLMDIEGWKPIPMLYDEKMKLWYYVYEKDIKKGKYRYRFSVDGLLISDPLNNLKEEDKLGGVFSVFELKSDIEIFRSNPKSLGNGYFEFRYKDLKAEKVVLSGSFNHWSPYELEMKREFGGIWRIKIYLPKGIHYYYFIVDDSITPDPLNMRTVRDKHGNIVNVLEIK